VSELTWPKVSEPLLFPAPPQTKRSDTIEMALEGVSS
jgi:hypothetical protein